jgi:pilus assembly protein FimV
MSDPNLKDEEDDLISQDDIDKLLDISSEENDSDELSQDDIDSLLNESGPDAGEDDAEELSQDDIDRMMAGNALDEDDTPQDEDSELSQDDISQFMNNSQNSDSGDDGGDDELISLKDIQDVMSEHTQGNDTTNSESEPEQMPEAESNQDDVAEQTVEDAIVDDAPVTEAPGQGEDPFDEPIDESQATDVADCMITQESMDALIEASIAAPDVPETEDGDNQEKNLSDPINRMSTKDVSGADDAQENEDDVTQEDIDALLQQSDEKDELLDEDEDILISQDDINTLLMATDQEDEDLLGDIEREDDASDLENQPDDTPDDLESESSQVVLEDAEISDKKDSSPTKSDKKGGKIKAFLKSKVILAAASVLLFMGISVPLIYFLFFSSKPLPLPERRIASLTEIDLIRDVQDNVSADKPVLPPSRKSGTILLTDFTILASDQSRTMTYVSADISIDYSDQKAYDEINNNLAFYRDLIYEAIQTRLVSENNNEVTEANLLWGVETSLKKVLPPQYIDKISFKSFKTT